MSRGGRHVSQEEVDRDSRRIELLLTAALLLVAVVFFGTCGAFIYKVWNERQMTREYHEQAVQAKRIADVLEFFANEASAEKPVRIGADGHFEHKP